MSQSQDEPGDRGLESRIEDCLTGVLSTALLQSERRSGRIGLEKKSFFCRSDLVSIWSTEPRPLDVVFGHLNEGQRETLLADLLLFISFLVTIDVRPRFILSCKDVFFQTPQSTALKFKDDDGPRSRADLLQMGLTPLQANSWKQQYHFRPAKITLDLRRWEPQRIDPLIPLPFELTEDVSSGVRIHGGFGDDTGDESQYGTVKLYTIPSEYIEIRASETWTPTAPLLRIVKSFSARQRVIEEAKNMELLKQSLVFNRNISIHDAIIEQRQEDDTGIVSIVFPYASLGDLAQFLAGGYGIIGQHWDQIYDVTKQFPRVTDTQQLRMSLLGQSKNLASALEFLHNGFTTEANDWKIQCAHLDLKPSNILIFESSQDEVVGHWKLCDFGISVFDAERLQGLPTAELGSAGDFFNKLERTIRTSPRRIPGVYQAPEIEHSDYNSSPEYGARTSDIWSFGTIFAEVLAYAQGGADEVKTFDKKRKRRATINGERARNDFFYTTIPEHMRSRSSELPYMLREEVSAWLNEFIFECQPGPSPSGVCLRCWAKCVKSILEVNPHNRPNAPMLSQWIEELYRHAKGITVQHIEFVGPGPRNFGPVPIENDDEEVSEPSECPETPEPPEPPEVPWPNTVRKGLSELRLSSREVIDYDLDGKRLVYLTKTSIDLFLVNSQKRDPKVKQTDADHKWRGIKVAEPYVVVWGSKLSYGGGSALRVYKIKNGQLSRSQSSPHGLDFNVTRRVAVSRQGYIAVIRNDEILILDANKTDLKELFKFKMEWQYPVGKFVDIAFDSSGSTLYAWGNQHLSGVLCAYEFDREGSDFSEIYQGKYKKAFSEHNALILPFDKRRECVIAVGPTSTSFFLGNVEHPRRDSSSNARRNSSSTGPEGMKFTSQKFSEHPSGYHAWAGCTNQGSMLLVGATRPGLLAHRKVEISEKVIGADGRLCFSSRSSQYPALETKIPWWPLNNPVLNTDVKVGVVPSNGAGEDSFIVVYYKKGLIEVL